MITIQFISYFLQIYPEMFDIIIFLVIINTVTIIITLITIFITITAEPFPQVQPQQHGCCHQP